MAKTRRGKAKAAFWATARSSDSKFESQFSELYGLEKARLKISYVSHHTYTPDFVVGGEYKTMIELKGRFRTSAEARKYKDISDTLDTGDLLVFVFQNPQLPMPHAKTRRDGTKQTHAEWAEKNGFRWFTLETIGKIL